MSEPIRYTQLPVCVEPSYQAQEVVSPMAKTVKGGEWVKWEDYARLKAEVERLEPELEQRCRELNLSLAQQAIQLRQIGELKAEVERLRKAGDWMLNAIILNSDKDIGKGMDAWNAAKEGKQS